MNLDEIPDNYSAVNKTYKRNGYLVYPVKPDKGNHEDDARVLLSWEKDWGQWVAYIEGIYKENGKIFPFIKGPFNINSEATRRICKHYGFPVEMSNYEGTTMLISLTSPEWFKQIKEKNK
jgi:hypothetical protein